MKRELRNWLLFPMLGTFALCGVIALVYAIMGWPTTSPSDRVGVVAACQEQVRARLTNPESASFSQPELAESDSASMSLRVSGDGYAENSFGVKNTFSYACYGDDAGNASLAFFVAP